MALDTRNLGSGTYGPGGTFTPSSPSTTTSNSSNLTAPTIKSSSSSSSKSSGGGGGGSYSLRDAASSLGANVDYDPNTDQVSVRGSNGRLISFGNGQGSQYGLSGLSNGSNTVSDFDAFAKALGYSPVRSSAESRGLNVGWDGQNINLTDNNGMARTLNNGFSIGSNGSSYMKTSDLSDLFSDYQNASKKAQMPQQVPQGLQAVAQQLMQSLLAPGTKPQLPSFAGQEQALQSAYQSKLRAIEGGLADSKSSLEDKYFQNYLAARQAMANRGLAGSGLASDQDTRLLLAKQKDLAGIERDAARGKLDAADWLGGAQASLADKEYNAQQEALANASKGRAENLKTLSSFISQMMPYEQATVAEQMKNQLGYDQLDQDTRNFLDTLDFKYADLGQRATDNAADRTLKWVNTMGYDQDGNLTENSRHNRTTEALTDQGQKLNYNAKMAGIQAGLQKAAMAGARASSSGSGPKPTQSDRDRMIGQEDIEIFLRNIDLSKDSRSSSQKLIDQARAGRKIDAEGYKILTAANSAFWDEQDNRKAAIASAGEDEYRAGQHASEASFNDATDSSTIPLYVDDPYGIYGN